MQRFKRQLSEAEYAAIDEEILAFLKASED